jgi:hypothetical protein
VEKHKLVTMTTSLCGKSGAGSGSENKKFLDKLDELPGFGENIEPALQRKAAANIKGDAGFGSEKGLPLCSDIQNAREIFVEQGRAGLQAALDSGVILPAVRSRKANNRRHYFKEFHLLIWGDIVRN